MPAIPFAEINRHALASGYLNQLYPQAKAAGNELQCGDIHGGPGRSFCINPETGAWIDNGTDQRGGDLISLVAKRDGLSQGDAARRVAEESNFPGDLPPLPLPQRMRKQKPERPTIGQGTDKPAATKPDRKALSKAPATGEPTHIYPYYNPDGSLAFEMWRFEKPGYRKLVIKGKGVYNPDLLYNLTDALQYDTVFVVEGENKVEALKAPIVGLSGVCNPSGAGKWRETHSKALAGKKVIILPDNDGPGQTHAAQVAKSVYPYAASVKIVDLPGLPPKGDVVDWLAAGNDPQSIVALMDVASLYGPPAKDDEEQIPLRPIQRLNPADYSGMRYLEAAPPAPDWLLVDSLPRGCIGAIIAPSGTGKGYMALQLSANLAAGAGFFGVWDIPRPFKVLYLTAEESPRVVHERALNSLKRLPPETRQDAAGRLWAIPLQGLIHMSKPDGQGGTMPTDNYFDLDNLIGELRPDVVFVDTFAKFAPCPENDNQAVTIVCGLFEELAAKHGCNVIFLHHTRKAGGAFADSKDELRTALSQSAIRGASALPACIRWGLMMVPLSEEFAFRLIGKQAEGKPAGTFVAARVGKKNEGRSESVFFLDHGENGLFGRVEACGDDSELADAYKLAEEVRRRESSPMEPLLSETKGGQEAFGWGIGRSKKATQKAVGLGLIVSKKRTGIKGYYLASSESSASSDEAGTL
jgi:hypothetical protein